MRTYKEARALAGQRLEASNTNGRTKYISFELHDDGTVTVDLLGTRIVAFYRTGVEIHTGGYVTPTTFDGIATALNVQRGRTWCGTVKRVPFLLWHRMTEGMQLDYEGNLMAAGEEPTPLGPTRKRAS